MTPSTLAPATERLLNAWMQRSTVTVLIDRTSVSREARVQWARVGDGGGVRFGLRLASPLSPFGPLLRGLGGAP